ncbi:MAG: hypothetical protein H6926_04025 [Chromatiales bacterium]|nr:hypothetical protein [Gammaproteobacteria bacterium]MCP5352342.1 hypothetical protein [Chromatiales bacterium]
MGAALVECWDGGACFVRDWRHAKLFTNCDEAIQFARKVADEFDTPADVYRVKIDARISAHEYAAHPVAKQRTLVPMECAA